MTGVTNEAKRNWNGVYSTLCRGASITLCILSKLTIPETHARLEYNSTDRPPYSPTLSMLFGPFLFNLRCNGMRFGLYDCDI